MIIDALWFLFEALVLPVIEALPTEPELNSGLQPGEDGGALKLLASVDRYVPVLVPLAIAVVILSTLIYWIIFRIVDWIWVRLPFT